MTQEALYLRLVMHVPNSNDPILATRDQVLAVRGDRGADDFIIMTSKVFVELFASEKQLLLRLEVPLYQAAVLAPSHKTLVITGPVHARDSAFVAFHERPVEELL